MLECTAELFCKSNVKYGFPIRKALDKHHTRAIFDGFRK
jgi:hypothetical protein